MNSKGRRTIMPSYNHVVLCGHLVRDIELKYTKGNTAVAEISIAVNENRKKGDEWVKEVGFFDCTLWGRNAENASKYLGKGSAILVDGTLRQERWQTEDGQNRSKVKVNVKIVQFMGGRSDEQPTRSTYDDSGAPPRDESEAPKETHIVQRDDDGNIPF